MKAVSLLATAMVLAGCGAREQAAITGARPPGPTASERAYQAPPAVAGAVPLAGGRVVLSGRAAAGARVRVATPAGELAYALAGLDGRWRLTLPAASSLRLFGVSMVAGGRAIQSEGYLAVTPDGDGAQLRAGSGAVVLGSGGGAPRLLAVDFDSQGVAVVSGTAAPGAAVTVRVDGLSRGQVTADPAGRFSLAIDEPLAAGDHRLEVSGLGRSAEAEVDIVAPRPFSGPFAAVRAANGWRVDWTTPGGGRQTTLLLAPARAAT